MSAELKDKSLKLKGKENANAFGIGDNTSHIEGGLTRIREMICRSCKQSYMLDYGTNDQGLLEICYMNPVDLFECPSCQNQGEINMEHYQHEQYIKRAVKCGIPENCVFSEVKNEFDKLAPMIRKYRYYSLFIHDSGRLGKSRLICAIAAEIAQDYKVFYRTCADLKGEYTARLGDDGNRVEEYLHFIVSHHLIIIDDMFKSRVPSGFGEFLYRIMDKAVINKRKLWASANESVDDLVKYFDLPVAGENVRDRIKEMCLQWNGEKGHFKKSTMYKGRK